MLGGRWEPGSRGRFRQSPDAQGVSAQHGRYREPLGGALVGCTTYLARTLPTTAFPALTPPNGLPEPIGRSASVTGGRCATRKELT